VEGPLESQARRGSALVLSAIHAVRETNTVGAAATQVLADQHRGAMGPVAAAQKLPDDDDDLALGVPFAEVPQRLGHLTQPLATVDDRRDPSCLAELNDRRQALRTQSYDEESELLALINTFCPGWTCPLSRMPCSAMAPAWGRAAASS
jgi:hypothetical protein